MSYVDLDMIIDGHKETRQLAVTNLNCLDIFIGHDWLQFQWTGLQRAKMPSAVQHRTSRSRAAM